MCVCVRTIVYEYKTNVNTVDISIILNDVYVMGHIGFLGGNGRTQITWIMLFDTIQS